MADENYFKTHDQYECVNKLLLALEALSWLHNCTKIQIGKGLLSHDYLSIYGYWMVMREQRLYYSKAKEQSIKCQNQQVQNCIIDSNRESMKNYAYHEAYF